MFTYATPWVNVENIRLSDISQKQKDTCCTILLVTEQIHNGRTVVVMRRMKVRMWSDYLVDIGLFKLNRSAHDCITS